MLPKYSNIVVAFIVLFAIGYAYAESCVSCSSNNDINCAQYPEKLMARSCSTNNSKCYSRIIDGETIRGCTDELDQEVVLKCASTNCEICQDINLTPGCNNRVFPEQRLACHICKGDNPSVCSQAMIGNPIPCKNYKEDDQCFIHKTEKTFERGCLSDSGLKCNNATHCYLCTGQGCNSENGESSKIPVAPSSATMLTTSLAWASFVFCIISIKAFF